jgi:hypothetical protein
MFWKKVKKFLVSLFVLHKYNALCTISSSFINELCICLGHKTYFIEGRQLYSPYDHDHCHSPVNKINLRLIISPAVSPQSALSFNHSPPMLSARDNDLRNDKTSPRIHDVNNFLSPNPFNFRNKASSLPSILDSDTELDDKREKVYPEGNDNSSKSPTSVGKFYSMVITTIFY